MIVSQIKGGLGNQMFQYAAGFALSQKHETNYKVDTSNYSKNNYREFELVNFKLSATTTNFFENFSYSYGQKFPFKQVGLGNRNYFQERHFHYNKLIEDLGKDAYLSGHWFSYRYFQDYENQIRDEFRFVKPIPKYLQDIKKQIQEGKSVSIHVRRGDYVHSKKFSALYPAVEPEYYFNAVKRLLTTNEIKNLFIFSDDISWCKENLHFKKVPTTYVSESSRSGIEDLQLMSLCNHAIIANSSFSWWGAWLINKPDKVVIAPKKWFKDNRKTRDICPKDWIIL